MKNVDICVLTLLMLQSWTSGSNDAFDNLDELNEEWNTDMDNMFTFDKTQHTTVDSFSSKLEKVFVSNDQTDPHNLLNALIKCQENQDMLNYQVKSYIIRYINVFLVFVGLKDQKLNNLNTERFTVNLEFSVTAENLLFLQNLSRNLSGMKFEDQLSKIDNILATGLDVKYDSIWINILSWIKYFIYAIDLSNSYPLLIIRNFSYLLLVFLNVIIVRSPQFRNTSKICLFSIVLNSFILLEGIINYYQKLQEAKIADFVSALQRGKLPDECDPEKMSFWSEVSSWFGGNKCLEYYTTMAIKTAEKVSPLECIIQSYSLYLLEIPCKVFASCIRTFSESLNEIWPKWFGPIPTYFTTMFILTLITVLIVFAIGPRIRLRFLAGIMEFEFLPGGLNEKPHNPLPQDEARLQNSYVRDVSESESKDITRARIRSAVDWQQRKGEDRETLERDSIVTENINGKCEPHDSSKGTNDNLQPSTVEFATPDRVTEDVVHAESPNCIISHRFKEVKRILSD